MDDRDFENDFRAKGYHKRIIAITKVGISYQWVSNDDYDGRLPRCTPINLGKVYDRLRTLRGVERIDPGPSQTMGFTFSSIVGDSERF
jgi:hypothetical protein